MLDIRKWNYEKHEYEPYEVDPNWHVVLFSRDMELKINCAQGGEEMTYGQGYTSRELHNSIGLGYPVCEKCYSLEKDREVEAKQ